MHVPHHAIFRKERIDLGSNSGSVTCLLVLSLVQLFDVEDSYFDGL